MTLQCAWGLLCRHLDSVAIDRTNILRQDFMWSRLASNSLAEAVLRIPDYPASTS